MRWVDGYWTPDSDEIWELWHLEEAMKVVTDFGCAIDGGANVGGWSFEMAKRFKTVHAFEPSCEAYLCLQRNVPWNVLCHYAALGSSPGKCSVVSYKRRTTGSFVTYGEGDVDVVTIDELSLGNLGLIKLDIEGAEAEALKGAAQTIARCRPAIIVEEKTKLMARFGYDRLDKIMDDMGYAVALRMPICDVLYVHQDVMP